MKLMIKCSIKILLTLQVMTHTFSFSLSSVLLRDSWLLDLSHSIRESSIFHFHYTESNCVPLLRDPTPLSASLLSRDSVLNSVDTLSS